ncbi:MAG: hypothetical protein AB1633_09075 [Elusimicrobiota bacterium]
MTWLQILAQACIIAIFVGAGIAVAAYFNGKHIKEGVTKLGSVLDGIEKTLAQMEKNAEQRHLEVIALIRKTSGA